jgi:DNA polymerase I-like protein with 3'-5' exonuclease and polymerase domains
MTGQESLLSSEVIAESASHKHDTSAYKLPREFPDLSAEPVISIDLETRDMGIGHGLGVGTRREGSFIAGVGVGTPDKQWYFPIRHAVGENCDPEQVMNWCRDTFKNPKQDKLFANALYDLDYLAHAGINVAGRYLDVQVAEPLIDENKQSYSLNSLAEDYLGERKHEEALYQWCAEVYGGKPNRKQAGNIWRAPAAIVEPYAHSDCYLPFPIFEKQSKLLHEQGLLPVFEMETGIIPMLLAMRQRGARFDEEKAVQVREYMQAEQHAIEAQLSVITGKEVDIWAAQSIAELFHNLRIPYPKTPTGAPSFTADWLKSSDQKIANLIYQARRWDKARGTFIEGLLKYSINGRIHTEFNQLRKDDAGAVSGRFSCSNPNLQNQPARDKEMLQLVRSLFIPEDGHRMVSLDYSQVEFRVLTHFGSGHSAEIAQGLYRDNPETDFHTMVAELTGMERTAAKNVTFALAYGAGVSKMASMVGCSRAEAQRMFDTYHERLPFLKELSDLANRGYYSDGAQAALQHVGAKKLRSEQINNACAA